MPTVHTADDVVCGVVRPMCELCEGIVRGYRHGLVSEGRAAEQIGVNRLQLRYIADANLCGEEPN